MIETFIILALAAFFFIQGKIRSDLVALCALVALMLFQVISPKEALSGFSSEVVIMMVGLFIIGGSIFQTGLAKMISNSILKLAGTSETRLFMLTMLVTAAIGAFVSNTGTVALMLPIVVSMAVSANISPSRLLMPLAFASSMGGMLTLIGTPPNLIVSEELAKSGYEPLSFFSFTPVGLISIAVGIVLLLPLSKWFLSGKGKEDSTKKKGKSPTKLAQKYRLSQNIYRIKVLPHSKITDKTLRELAITANYAVSVVEIRRRTSNNPFAKLNQEMVGADTQLLDGDIVYLLGSFENVEQFVTENQLELIDEKITGESEKNLRFLDIGIAEIVLMPTSILRNVKVRDTDFRHKYNVNILAVERKDEYILHDIKDVKLQGSDVLLIQGAWEDIARLSEEDSEQDWVVLGRPLAEASKVTRTEKAPVAAIIMILMVLCMALEILPGVTAVLLASILMVFTGCLKNMEEAYKTINWESIVLIAAMMPMSLALQNTGAAKLMSDGLVSGLGSYGPMVLLAGVYLTTSMLTMVISNTATAVLVAPIALQAAIGIGVNPMPFMFAVSVAASMCFASPFSTPPNALVMSAGRYTFMDYVKVGLPLQLAMAVVMIIVLPLLFPF